MNLRLRRLKKFSCGREGKSLVLDKIEKYLNESMVLLPEGIELIRDFQDLNQWINSNSKMSIPGTIGNKKETKDKFEIKPFFLLQFPVTIDIYDFITSEVGSELNNPIPIVNVSWNEAVRFCNSLSLALGYTPCYSFNENMNVVTFNKNQNGFRLPTDAEWQYACRAKSKGYRYGELDSLAWYQANSLNQVHPVGQKLPNVWDLYDMLGNVWEWCWDLYDEKRYGTYRVFRGGSWAEEARSCGATSRRKSFPDFKIDDLGFRIARSL